MHLLRSIDARTGSTAGRRTALVGDLGQIGSMVLPWRPTWEQRLLLEGWLWPPVSTESSDSDSLSKTLQIALTRASSFSTCCISSAFELKYDPRDSAQAC